MYEFAKTVFEQYEAAREIEDKENRTISPVIEDAYDAMDEADYEIEHDGDMSESSADKLENAYNKLYLACVRQACFIENHPLWIACHALENAMIKYGLLEPDEEPEDEEDCLDERLDGSTNWDELEADRRFDMYRDMALMGYEY